MSAQITALTAEVSKLHNVLQLAMKFLPSRAMPRCFKTTSKVKVQKCQTTCFIHSCWLCWLYLQWYLCR